ncbi:hypothetical protein CYMTET_47777 [Cymbomonas tetramitiformis]|uniref:Uncharacterized protein n=1 Tax=Cymbomonas tetramitiformis TaxID=36881 RepID=A0AAE0EVQ4_9CHLO|nr:hypothetical protein CYMTET_47777 [Cymbomonas tetramitiformis]
MPFCDTCTLLKGSTARSAYPYNPETDKPTFMRWYESRCEECRGDVDVAGPRCLADGCFKKRSKVGHKNAFGVTYRLCTTCLREKVGVRCHVPTCMSEPRGIKQPFTCQNHSALVCSAVGCGKKAKLGLHGYESPVCGAHLKIRKRPREKMLAKRQPATLRLRSPKGASGGGLQTPSAPDVVSQAESLSTPPSPLMVSGVAAFCWPSASLYTFTIAPVTNTLPKPPIRPTPLLWTPRDEDAATANILARYGLVGEEETSSEEAAVGAPVAHFRSDTDGTSGFVRFADSR